LLLDHQIGSKEWREDAWKPDLPDFFDSTALHGYAAIAARSRHQDFALYSRKHGVVNRKLHRTSN
jgi:hypothetical protein